MEPTREVPPVGRPPEIQPPRGVRRRPEPSQAAPPSDEVSLSPEGQELLKIRHRIAQAPDVREDLVDTLRQAVQEGRYRPPAREIARRLMPILRLKE